MDAALKKTSQIGSFAIALHLVSHLGQSDSSANGTGLIDLKGNRIKVTTTTSSGLHTPSQETVTIAIGHDMWQTFGAPNEWNHQPITTSRNLAGIPMPEPARLFTDLQGLTTITQEGNARVNGVDTTHYKGVETYSSPTGHETKTVDLWISSDNLVRRLTSVTKLTLDTPGSTGGSTTVETSETLDAQFSQFGIPTNIQPPPANEVVGSASTPSG